MGPNKGGGAKNRAARRKAQDAKKPPPKLTSLGQGGGGGKREKKERRGRGKGPSEGGRGSGWAPGGPGGVGRGGGGGRGAGAGALHRSFESAVSLRNVPQVQLSTQCQDMIRDLLAILASYPQGNRYVDLTGSTATAADTGGAMATVTAAIAALPQASSGAGAGPAPASGTDPRPPIVAPTPGSKPLPVFGAANPTNVTVATPKPPISAPSGPPGIAAGSPASTAAVVPSGERGGAPLNMDDMEDMRQPTVQNLMQLGFTAEAAEKAVTIAIQGGPCAPDTLVTRALDWMCVNLATERVTPAPAPAKPRSAPPGITVVPAGATVVDPVRGALAVHIVEAGFGMGDALRALEKHAGDVEAAIDELLSALAPSGRIDVPAGVTLQQERDDEDMVLQAMFEGACERETPRAMRVKIGDARGVNLKSPLILTVRLTPNSVYPYERALFTAQHPDLRFDRAGLMRKIADESLQYIGQPAIYNIIEFVREHLCQFVAKQDDDEEVQYSSRKKEAKPAKPAPVAAKTPAELARDRVWAQREEEIARQQAQEEEQREKDRMVREALAKREREEELRRKALEEAARQAALTPVPQANDEDEDDEDDDDSFGSEEGEEDGEEAAPVDEAVVKESMQADVVLMGNLSKIHGLQGAKPAEIRAKRKAADENVIESIFAGREYVPPVITPKQRQQLDRDGASILRAHQQFVKSNNGKKLLGARGRLPAAAKNDEIMAAIRAHRVVVISGETGCGKTTQVPQFIYDDLVAAGRGAEANILVTQPRRLSAMSVAERVAQERGERAGKSVGYHIRLEVKKSAETRILFCTTGVVLRRLHTDPFLSDVTHIIVDEIHERDLNTDFLLIILRDVVAIRPDIRLVLMSATLNAAMFATYFGSILNAPCPIVEIPGFTHPVEIFHLEDIVEQTGYSIEAGSPYAKRGAKGKGGRGGGGGGMDAGPGRGGVNRGKRARDLIEANLATTSAGASSGLECYSESTAETIESLDEEKINYDLLEELILYINKHHGPGAILVFLPGLAEITTLYEQLTGNTEINAAQFLVLPLHSSLPTAEQQTIFAKPKEGVRKVVLSTNIAETSITIDDVVYVIDSGRLKEKRYDDQRQMSSLEEDWVSKANMRQRKGRAGRVQPGMCFCMYTRARLETFEPYQLPEMQRTALDELALQIRFLDYGLVHPFLTRALSPPSRRAIDNALGLLLELGALDANQDVTPLGFHLAALPVEVRIGKIMLMGAVFRCLDPVLTVAASLSFRSPFVSPLDRREEAEAKKRAMAVAESDHLTVIRAYDGWLKAKSQGKHKDYCWQNFVSHSTLLMISDMRAQFFGLLCEIGFADRVGGDGRGPRNQVPPAFNVNSDNLRVVKAVICAGLYPSVARVEPVVGDDRGGAGDQFKLFARGREEISIHPVSVNFNAKRLSEQYVMFYEKMKTSKVYIRDCSSVPATAIVVFSGTLQVDVGANLVTVDNWIRFRLSSRTGVLIKQLRAELDSLLLAKAEAPTCPVSTAGDTLIAAIVALLSDQRAG